MENQNNGMNRRDFLSSTALMGAIGTLGAGAIVTSGCGGSSSSEVKPLKAPETLNLPPLLDQAPDGKPLKAGLIGCGGRGTGAAINFLSAGPNLSVVALGDVFEDRLNNCRKKLKEQKNNEVADENCFLGFDAFEKVIDAGVDVVIIATPPHFRPTQFAAAVQARKHVFMEKPVAVDPLGAKSIMASAKKAESLGLCVVTGTQRRHQHDYIGTYKKIMAGEIGEITAAYAYWNQSQLWYRERKPEWTDMEFMVRDWVNWCWLSGDHIVEQHIHNYDVIHWFMGKHPVKAVGFGSRQRRVTGDQYDNFSVDFVFDDGRHMHSMCRQINGCTNNVSEFIVGTKGMTNCSNKILNPDGSVRWEYEYPHDENGKPSRAKMKSPYDQEHVDLVTAIRNNTPVNEAEQTAITNLVGIMGRMSAYSGKEVTWDEVMNSNLQLGPDVYELAAVDMEFPVPVPGTEEK